MNTIIPTLDPSRDWGTLTDEEKRRAILSIRYKIITEDNDVKVYGDEHCALVSDELDICYWAATIDELWGRDCISGEPDGLELLDWAGKTFGSIGLWSTPLMTNSNGLWHCDCGPRKAQGNTSKDALWHGVYRAWQERTKEARHDQ